MPTPVHRLVRCNPIAALVTFAAILVAGAMYIVAHEAGKAAAREATAVVQRQAAKGCDRNQVQRGYLQTRASEERSTRIAEMAVDYFRIVNCKATYHGDATAVYLPRGMERCFLARLTSGAFGVNAERATTDPSVLRSAYACR